VSGTAGQGPEVVNVRLSGDLADIEAAAAALAGWTLERSAPYPNRRDPGHCVYLTSLITSAPAGPILDGVL
jgi:hypothetical protein